MRITPFAGLTVLEPGEPFSTDGYSFQDRNPDLTDRMLRVGAVTHKHDEHVALADPTIAPSASAVGSGGSFPAEVDAQFGYTLIDAYGGESMISTLAEVTTPAKLGAPAPPSGSADYAAGALLAGTYSYVKTWVDGAGGETEASMELLVAVNPGHASGRVRFTNMSSGMVAAGATGWRLYKSANGSYYHYIASGTGATVDDDGSLCADCTTRPPTTNTTADRNTVTVEMPASAALPSAAVAFRLYGSIGVGISSPSFFGQYPRASGGSVFSFAAFNPGDGSPPPISTTIPGASKIDPDTDLVEFPWKRPVASAAVLPVGDVADVRMAKDTHRLFTPSASGASGAGWLEIPGNVEVQASGSSAVIKARRVVIAGIGSGAVVASGDIAIVTIPSGGSGGSGVTPLTWTALSYAGGVADNNDSVMYTASWAKDDYGIVHLRGKVAGNVAQGGTMFTLPSGACPAAYVLPMAWMQDTSGWEYPIRLEVAPTGTVKAVNDLRGHGTAAAWGSSIHVCLDGITFPTLT